MTKLRNKYAVLALEAFVGKMQFNAIYVHFVTIKRKRQFLLENSFRDNGSEHILPTFDPVHNGRKMEGYFHLSKKI